ncbi:MAG: helix-turn-helix transcriptional regulator [Pseudomonadota bacterium]
MVLNITDRDTSSPGSISSGAAIDRRIAALTELVGSRLRAARKARGLSRRELSERSGVSQRYLAQVESGGGNISIALLLKVGTALDRRVEWFVEDSDPAMEPDRHVAHLYAQANHADRSAIDAILSKYRADPTRARRVALIGLRGAGKSTLGRRASEALSVPFVELNHEIEAQSGMPVADVMALYGQEGYRTLEHTALRRVANAHETVILAVAGGIVGAPDTFDLLLEQFHTVWLRAAPEAHMNRVRAQGDERPMAGNPSAMEDLQAILRSREALYARADVELDTSAQGEDATLTRLVEIIRNSGFIAGI